MLTKNPNNWGACPTGEWQKLSAGLLLRKRLVALRNTGIGLIAALGLAGGSWAAVSQFREKPVELLTPCHVDPMPVPIMPECPTLPSSKQ